MLRIDGSIMAGVFLTSSFCVVPECSSSSNTASSSLFVHVELGTQTGLVQLIALSQQCTASFKDLHIIGGSRRYWQLFSSVDPYTVVIKATHHQTVVVMVSYYVTFVVTVYGEIFGEPNGPQEVSKGFKTLGFMKLEALLGLLSPCIDKIYGVMFGFTGSFMMILSCM